MPSLPKKKISPKTKAAPKAKGSPKQSAAARAAKTTARTAKTTPQSKAAPTTKPRVFGMPFASVYPLYVQKAEKKGRTKAEVDAIIAWLTGYAGKALDRALSSKASFEDFFANAPRLNPNVGLITGLVCGVRVEDIDDPLMRKIRYLDKLIDELARGKKIESILRS